MNTVAEALPGTRSDYSTLRVLGYAAFVHVHKERQRDKFEGRIDRGIYLSDESGFHRVYLLESRRAATTKHVSVNERQLPFKKQSKKTPTVRAQHKYTANEKDGTEKETIFLDVTVDGEANNGKNVYVSDNISQQMDHRKEASQETVKNPARRSTGTRMDPSWFKINAWPRTCTQDEPSVKEALNGDDIEAWKNAIKMDVSTLQEMSCWDVVDRPKSD